MAGAALALVGEEGHEGDVGLGVLAEVGVGEAGGGDALGVGDEQVVAEVAGHSGRAYQVGAVGRTGRRGPEREEKWKRGRVFRAVARAGVA